MSLLLPAELKPEAMKVDTKDSDMKDAETQESKKRSRTEAQLECEKCEENGENLSEPQAKRRRIEVIVPDKNDIDEKKDVEVEVLEKKCEETTESTGNIDSSDVTQIQDPIKCDESVILEDPNLHKVTDAANTPMENDLEVSG